jgi:hypothetical protein
MAANGGLLQFCRPSPNSQFGELQAEIVESLRTFFEIFPFSGDCGRRPRFDPYCVAEPAVEFVKFSAFALE